MCWHLIASSSTLVFRKVERSKDRALLAGVPWVSSMVSAQHIPSLLSHPSSPSPSSAASAPTIIPQTTLPLLL